MREMILVHVSYIGSVDLIAIVCFVLHLIIWGKTLRKIKPQTSNFLISRALERKSKFHTLNLQTSRACVLQSHLCFAELMLVYTVQGCVGNRQLVIGHMCKSICIVMWRVAPTQSSSETFLCSGIKSPVPWTVMTIWSTFWIVMRRQTCKPIVFVKLREGIKKP